MSGDKDKKKCFSLTEGSLDDAMLLSPKFSSLCELSKLGLGTPPGFILSTVAAKDGFLDNKRVVSEDLSKEVFAHISELEITTSRKFGSSFGPLPLLLCVRVGVPAVQQQVMAGRLFSFVLFFIIWFLMLSYTASS